MNIIENTKNVWVVNSIDGEMFDLVTINLNKFNLPDNRENRKKLICSILKEPKAYSLSIEAYEKTINKIFKVKA